MACCFPGSGVVDRRSDVTGSAALSPDSPLTQKSFGNAYGAVSLDLQQLTDSMF